MKERSLAIPIEEIFTDLPLTKGQPINAPKLPADFLDRPDDLAKLKKLILSPGEGKSAITGRTIDGCQQTSTSIGLQGMGGIGKSVLAAALARDEQILEAFPDGVIWISLGQQPNLASRQLQLLRALEEDHRPISDVQDGLGSLRQILGQLSCLIILDDVWSMESIRAFDALGPDCRLLITTRDREIVRGLKARELCLDVLDEEKAMLLLALSSGLKPEDLDPKAREVAEECDRLPLALAMVGSMVRAALERGRSDPWEHILHRLRSADLEKIKAEFPGYPYPNLLRAIEVSVESLEPEEQRRYLDLAVFPEDTLVPEAALRLIWGLDEYDTRDLADLLADRSLASFSSGRLWLHDLQHDFAVKGTGDLQMLHNRMVEAYREVSPNGWHTGPDDSYFFQHLAYHLNSSGRKRELKELDLDLRWIEARLVKTNLTSLISEYDLMVEDEEIRLCRDCLQLSSHVLFEDLSQLAGQLLGRMQQISSPGIGDLIKQARESKEGLWLRPLTPSLNPPGWALIRILSGHSGVIESVALTPDGRHAVSASLDGTLKIWDIESGLECRTLSGHLSGVNAVAITPDGLHAVSGSNDNTLKVWDLKSGREVRTLSGHSMWINDIAVTPDGRYVVSASSDGTLKVWDLDSGYEVRTLSGHSDWINSVIVTPDGLHAVSGSNDNTLKIWDLKSGREVRTLSGHSNWINDIAVTPDGCFVISASLDGTLKVWNLESGHEVRTLSSHSGSVNAVCLMPDGHCVISGSRDQTLRIWDLESGLEIRTIANHTGNIADLIVTHDGRHLISASSDIALNVWDLGRGCEVRTVSGHSGAVNSVIVTPDGLHAVSGSNDKTLKIWDLESGHEVRTLVDHFGGIKAVAITTNGGYAILGSDDCTLKIWDLENDREIRILPGHSDWVVAIALTNDGLHAVSGSHDKTLKVWDLETGREIRILSGHSDWVTAVALTPDSRRAISASFDETLKVWDLESGREVKTLSGNLNIVSTVAVALNGRHAISASFDGTLKVWDLESGREVKTLSGHLGGVTAVSLTLDGHRAISSSTDNTLKVWDLEGNSSIANFTGDSSMLCCAVSPDGRTIVAGEASGRVHFLRLEGLPAGKGAKPQS